MVQQHKVSGVATSVRTEGGTTIVRYHNTDVVKFNSERITLDSGGWMTSTTKTRMNQASNEYGLGFNVHQDDGKWFVRHGGEHVPFRDGMVLSRQGGSWRKPKHKSKSILSKFDTRRIFR